MIIRLYCSAYNLKKIIDVEDPTKTFMALI